MILTMRQEAKHFRDLLRNHYREWAVISLATLFLVLSRTHPLGPRALNHLVYYFALPVASILVLLRANPLDFGLRLGQIRLWGIYLVVAAAISAPIVLVGSRDPTVLRYYQGFPEGFTGYFLEIAVVLFAWEFLFRGFMLFGLEKHFKEGAIFVQMIPFALLHLGKPKAEVILCILVGVLFGQAAYRCRSFWPAFLMHLFVNVANRLVVNAQL